MCDQTQVSYLPGDIVWVKLSSLWWPAEVQDPSKLESEVTGGLKKQPLAVVKFFNEEAYQYPKNLDQIYHYNCLKKDEFIKKGLDLLRAAASKTPSRSVPSSIDKFPNDVSTAEEKTNGDPQYINNPKFAHSEPNSDDTKEEGPSDTKQNRKRSTLSNNPRNLATPLSKTKFSMKKLTPKTILKNNLNGSKTPSSLRKNKHPKLNIFNLLEPKYSCIICESFVSQHCNVLLKHMTYHFMGKLPDRPPVIPRRYLSIFNETEKHRSQKPLEAEDPKRQEKRKRKKSEEPASKKSISGKQQPDSLAPPKKRNKKPKTPPPEEVDVKQEVALEILKDWSDSEDEVELKKDSGTKTDASSPEKSLNSLSPKNVTTTPVKAEKSCFDFEDNEDSLNVDGALKFGQKLPRVLHEKHSSNRLRTSSKTDDNQDELSKQVDSFLETINVPNVPEIPETITSLKEDTSFDKKSPGTVESEIAKKKTSNSSNKSLKSTSSEEFDSLKKKTSDASTPVIESVNSPSPLKHKHPVKKSLTSTEKDSKQVYDDPKDNKVRRKSQRNEREERNTEENSSLIEKKGDATRATVIHGKETVKETVHGKETVKGTKGITVNEDNHKDTKKKEYHNNEALVESPLLDEKINNSSPHFLSINEVKMKPPEKPKKTSRSDHKKETLSDKQVTSKIVKTDSESCNREKHDRKVKTKDKDLDLKSDSKKSPSKSDKHAAAKTPKPSVPEKGVADQIEQSTKHRTDSSTKDVVSKSKLETDKSPKKVEHSSKHEKGGKHRSEKLSTIEMESSTIEKGEKPTKQGSAKSVEQESGRITQHNIEKLVKIGSDKSERKQTEKSSEKDYHSSRKKQEKIKHVEKHVEKEKKLDPKDKYNKRKVENEKSRSDSKKTKKYKVEIIENTSNQEQNKNLKKIKKPIPKDPVKVDHKPDKKSNQTDSVKESINSFAIDPEKVSHPKSEDVDVETLKSLPPEKKNLGDLNLEKTFIKTSSSTFLSEPDIQTDGDQQLEDSNVSSHETSSELLSHPSCATSTKQDVDLEAGSSVATASEVCLREATSTSPDLGSVALSSTLNTSPVNVESSQQIEHPPLSVMSEHSATRPETSEQLSSQSLDTSSEDLKGLDPPDDNEISKNRETECLVASSESEPHHKATSKEKSQLEQTEINSSPLDTIKNISEDSDQSSNVPSSPCKDGAEKFQSLEAATHRSSVKGTPVQPEPSLPGSEIKAPENKLTFSKEESETLADPLTSAESVNTGQLHNEGDYSESTIEHSSNVVNEISTLNDSLTETNVQAEEKSRDTSVKGTCDSINGSLVAEDLDIKSMPIDIETGKDEGPLLEIMVGRHPFETVPGARIIEVHLRRVGEPFPKEFDHLEKIILPYRAKENENNNTIYGLKKMPFPKYNPEGACKGDIAGTEDPNTTSINDYNNNPKKLIIPLRTLNLQDDTLSTEDKSEADSKSISSVKVSDTALSLPKQVLVTMPRNVQTDHFKVPSQQIIPSQCSKFTPSKGTGKVIVCNSIRQIKTFSPGSMILPQSSLVTKASKTIKQISIPARTGLVQSKPTNILLNGSTLHSFQVSGNIQHLVPLTSATKQTEKEKLSTGNLQHPTTKKKLPNTLQKIPNILQIGSKKSGRQNVPEKSSKTSIQTVDTSVSTSPQTVVRNLQAPRTDQVLLLDLGNCTLPVQSSPLKTAKLIRVQNQKTVIKTSGQDILAEAIANTKVLQSDLDSSEFVGTSLTNSVLETSLTLNQPPIMSPLEVPSSVSSGTLPILASDQPTIFLSTPYVIDSSTPIILAPEGDSSGIEGEQKLILSEVTEQQKVGGLEDKDNVLPEFLKGDFSKKSPKKCDSSNDR